MDQRMQDIQELVYQHFEGERATVQDLYELKMLLDEAGILFWLQSGTLLGCMTLGRIIPGDTDVDLGMWMRDRSKFTAIIPKLRSLGFSVMESYDPGREGLQGLVSIKRNGLLIHLKMYEKLNGYAVMGIARNTNIATKMLRNIIHIIYFGELPYHIRHACYNHILLRSFIACFKPLQKILRQKWFEPVRGALLAICSKYWRKNGLYGIVAIPAHYFSDFRYADFYGIKFRIPALSESYLREEYGDEWMRFNPSGKGGLEKISHIVVSRLDCNIDGEQRRRLKDIGYKVPRIGGPLVRNEKSQQS